MLSVSEALFRVLADVPRLGAEPVRLEEALGRLLAADVVSPEDLPPWTNSAMDGYAVITDDLPRTLVVLETIAAGAVPTQRVERGQASRIMTGAPVPDGADAIVMMEDTVTVGEAVHIAGSARPGQHFRRQGSDVRAGDVVATQGQLLTAGRIGLLASLGIPTVWVARRPRVAIFSTGDEVVAPDMSLGPGQIHSSNTHALLSLVRESGGVPVDMGNIRDDPAKIAAAFAEAASCDIVVSTGGVSVGDFDHVKGAIGGGVEFWRVAMKPGKPLAYGHIGGTPVFGLPGNPVSCMVNFLQFVRPVLRAMMGDLHPFLPVVQAHLPKPLKRQPGRDEFVRVRLERAGDHIHAVPSGGHQGSGNVRSMADAHGFLLVGADATEVSGIVNVQVFDWSFMAGSEPAYGWADGAGASREDECC